ncbi:Demethylrebeccamycin-D-glucose O-methyltransferase [Actinomadura rubteroloni]|uniref:Demethylrebeccamycin-D-glucose O-methyltransferase n=1 Tax=Actinomadura rubteroloni TaxID=1926885 RepID=A0A2P4UDK1_9ACTN|nr:class I SAM-dependent methyltransferase [Actinomadura rubteroloni]POM23111.1 Demethylrebeccamycin-D-glucose O-methyltransferase [Actinomadura rubteroloni]
MTTRHSERYGDDVFSHAHADERERLEALCAVLDPVSFEALDALPRRSVRRCLELAAGTGSVARRLAERHPAAQVTATDLDLRFLDAAGHANLEYVRHDVTSDGFPDASFDLIHARYLLSHLPERGRVLADIAGWLAPGGQVVLEESALFPLWAARDETYRRVSMGVFTVLAERIGTDCEWPLDLPREAAECGLTDVKMRITCPTTAHDTPMGRFWRLTIRHLGPAITELPGIGPDDVPAVIDRLSRPGLIEPGMATVTVTATRPASPAR